jgi:hypothetical protein
VWTCSGSSVNRICSAVSDILEKVCLSSQLVCLTLQTEGGIIGHDHQNEGSWIPYLHGPVRAENAFAFVTAQNNWIPSSTWTQSLGDIPIGYFCDEPEVGQSAQLMCLIPHEPLPSDTVNVYVIASCLRFYERTCRYCLSSYSRKA